MAKASFSAYVLVKILLKTGEKVHFSTKKARPILVFLFFLPFSLFCLKIAKMCCFRHSKSQNRRQKTRPPPYIYIYIYGGDPNWWAHFGQKSQFFPSFIVKIGQEKPPQICGGFSCFQVFSSFFFLPYFALVFLLSLCFSTS